MVTTYLIVGLPLAVLVWIAVSVLERVIRQAWRPRRSTQIHAARSNVGRPGVMTVERQACPLWHVRGWRRDGKWLVGAYRTRQGACAGEILLDWRGRAKDYFLYN